MPLITQPLESLDSYVAFFHQQPLPVLKHTVRELQAMREHEDDINGRTVAALVLGDPLMTLKVLIHIEAHRRARQNHDITTIERAIMMMGISPFLREFSEVPTIEDQLVDYPKALVGVLRVISRSPSFWPIRRAVVSTLPPALKGTISVMGLVAGHALPDAMAAVAEKPAASKAAAATKVRRGVGMGM